MAAKRKRSEDSEAAEVVNQDAIPSFTIKYLTLNGDGTLRKPDKRYEEMLVRLEMPFKAKYGSKEPLTSSHVVLPRKQWWNLKKYSKFVIQGENFGNNEFVWVKPDDLNPADVNAEDSFWVARIHEVRAIDSAHVYAKVSWMYRPEQLLSCTDPVTGKLATGRRPYQGKHELIASNHIDIVDVTCFAGKAPVEHWLEEDTEDAQTGLYWRATYDFLKGRLSDVRRHCVCKMPYNPDDRMFLCDNKECGIWLHEACLIDNILQQTFKKRVQNSSSGSTGESITVDGPDTPNTAAKTLATPSRSDTKSKSKSPAPAPTSSAKKKGKKDYEGYFSAEIIQYGGDPPTVHITDLKAKPEVSWSERIDCLKCHSKLD